MTLPASHPAARPITRNQMRFVPCMTPPLLVTWINLPTYRTPGTRARTALRRGFGTSSDLLGHLPEKRDGRLFGGGPDEAGRGEHGAQVAITGDGRLEGPSDFGSIGSRERRPERGNSSRRERLDAAQAVRPGRGLQERERSEHTVAQEGDHVQRFEQLPPRQLGGRVVHPDPETVLDPLRIRLRVSRRGRVELPSYVPGPV